MKRILTTNEFPQWFSLKNYDNLIELSSNELDRELDFRRHMQLHFPLNTIANPTEKLISQKALKLIEEGKPKLTDYDWQQFHLARNTAIMNGEVPYIRRERKKHSKKHSNEIKTQLKHLKKFALNQDLIITPIRIRDVLHSAKHIDSLLKETGLTIKNEDTVNKFFLDLPATSVLKLHQLSKAKENYEEELMLSVNLTHASDEELISELRVQLEGWRKTLNIPEPLRVKSRSDDENKIFKYKIIPLIDINLWAKENCVKIKSSVFMAKVFPFGEYDSKEFSDYIGEFMSKILDLSYPLFGK